MEALLFEYVGGNSELKNAVVTIEREKEKSYFINFRPLGGVRWNSAGLPEAI